MGFESGVSSTHNPSRHEEAFECPPQAESRRPEGAAEDSPASATLRSGARLPHESSVTLAAGTELAGTDNVHVLSRQTFLHSSRARQ